MELPNTPGTLVSRPNPERKNGATVWKEFVIQGYAARLRLASEGEARNKIA